MYFYAQRVQKFLKRSLIYIVIAYENGADLGADYIECDVQITKVSSLLLKVSISYVIINYFDKIAGQLKCAD